MMDEHCTAQWLHKYVYICMHDFLVCFVILYIYMYPCAVPSVNKDVTHLLTLSSTSSRSNSLTHMCGQSYTCKFHNIPVF